MANERQRVAVIGAHPHSGGHSMRRYSALLFSAYEELEVRVSLLRPPSALSGRFRDGNVKKWMVYVEKFLLFPAVLLVKLRRQDLVHVVDQGDSPYMLMPRAKGRTYVCTCHDIFAIKAALGVYSGVNIGLLGRLYQRAVVRGLRRYEQIVCVSGDTKDDLEAFLGLPSRVVKNPLDPGLLTGLQQFRGVGKTHFLVVGEPSWRKQREKAILLWSRLEECSKFEYVPLVVVGSPLTRYERSLLSGRQLGRVRTERNVSEPDLAYLYASALCLLSLGNHEGFCWPVIEAAAAGTVCAIAEEGVPHDVRGSNTIEIRIDRGESIPSEIIDEFSGRLAAKLEDAFPINVSDEFLWLRFVEEVRSFLPISSPSARGL